MDREFSGRGVIVTGAASGLGRACAIALSHRGADLALADINSNGLEETLALCAPDSKVMIIPTDLSDPDACAALVDRAAVALDRIDALINVAGLLLFSPAAEITTAQWDKVFAINARAPFLLFQRALPHLLESEGAVVNVASASGLLGHPYIAAYGASKGALIALTRNLATEFMKAPIRINAVAPGPMITPMAAGTQLRTDYDIDLLKKGMGMREMAQPEDLCDIICLLASPRNKRVHGTVYSIDQGVTA